MGIDDISVLFVNGPNGLCHRIHIRKVSVELLQGLLHRIGDRIFSGLGKLFHQRRILLCIISCDPIDQALQITGDQDVHRRGRRQDEFPVSVIDTGGKEIKQNLIVVGSTDKTVDRKSHKRCIVSRKDISEISRGDHDVDPVSRLDLTGLHQLAVCIIVINHLRNQTSDIDGICR